MSETNSKTHWSVSQLLNNSEKSETSEVKEMKMSEVHVNITRVKSGNQITVHNPGLVPSNPLSGTAVTATKTASGSNATVQGQISAGANATVLFQNPA